MTFRVSYKLIRSKRRTIALVVSDSAVLIVRAPLRTPVAFIEGFIRERADWIRRTIGRIQRKPYVSAKTFANGEFFPYLGTNYKLVIANGLARSLEFHDGFIMNALARNRGRQFFTDWYKKAALKVIAERVAALSALHGLKPGRVKMMTAKRRWGSCSADGKLNFNWRLVMAPMTVIDHVVAHELAHLKHGNHSAAFWSYVKKIDPGYLLSRRWLRDHGVTLNF